VLISRAIDYHENGETGASISRSDFGENTDDMPELFAPHFANRSRSKRNAGA
jgi:hypothetical protein